MRKTNRRARTIKVWATADPNPTVVADDVVEAWYDEQFYCFRERDGVVHRFRVSDVSMVSEEPRGA